jgi:cyclopropane-fatty-acyl-phospholipid synthase
VILLPRLGLVDRAAQAVVSQFAGNAQEGRLDIDFPDGSRHVFGGARPGPEIRGRIKDPAFFARVLRTGEIGFGETYMDGMWEVDDLTGFLIFGILNRKYRPDWVQRVNEIAFRSSRRLHRARQNTLDGSRDNIHAHYDLSNDLFRLFLDETMGYSSAIFETPDQDLADAQRNKYDALCKKAGIGPGDRVLEIGCGWGGFAIHAALNYGCKVHAVTISQEQLTMAQQRVAEAGLSGQITLELCDYRLIKGQYDSIVSIEMFEAVGAEYFKAFFQACDTLLRPGGRLAMQTITVPERFYEALRDGVNWMQKYIFPGGMLPSITQLEASIRNTGLIMVSLEDIGPHYVTTLQEWRRRFTANLDQVHLLGFDDRFVRMWQYYLSYAEAGFETRNTGDLQVVFEKVMAK